MKYVNISVRKLAAIAFILFAICLAVGLYFAVPRLGFAEEQTTETLAEAEENGWVSRYVTVNGWSYGNYNPQIHIFEAEAKFNSDEIEYTVTTPDDKPVTNLALANAGTYTVTAEHPDIAEKLYGQLIIRKADNVWVQKPIVVGWEYGKYDKNTNLILATATYGTPKFTVRASNGSIRISSFTAPEGIVNKTTASLCSNLDADTYRLIVTVDGGDNYESINDNLEFEVKKTSNEWLLFPDVVQWQYGNYDINANLFLASTSYGRVSFQVKESENGKALTPVFTVSDGIINGDENGKKAAEVLANLKRGTYYLSASVEVTDLNRDGVSPRGKTFEVYEAANGWRSLPNVIGWQYGGYDAQRNLVMGDAYFGEVSFGIYNSEGESLTGLFTVTDGVIDDEGGTIAAILKGLPAGTYRLSAQVASDEDRNFSTPSADTTFTVTQAVNSWIDSPSIESWVKGKYNPDINFITAKSAFGEVEYIIYDTTDETKVIFEAKGGEGLLDKLSKAGSGYYTLKATVAATDDYSGLEKTFTFRIFPSAGLQWWVILLIVVGALGVVALVMFILIQKGVFHLLSDKFFVSMRAKMTVDATIAAVRANMAAEAAKQAAAEETEKQPEAEEKSETEKQPETEEKPEKDEKPKTEEKSKRVKRTKKEADKNEKTETQSDENN